MTVWLDSGVTDYVHGGESDSGFAMDIYCPQCKASHLVTLSVLGRFLFKCPSGAVVSGAIAQWRRERIVRKDPCSN